MEGIVNLVFEIQAKVQCPSVECGALCYYCMCLLRCRVDFRLTGFGL